MITYVNTVFVANDYSKNTLAGTAGNSISTITTSDAGKFVVVNVDTDKIAANTATRIKIGFVTGKTMTAENGTVVPVIKWSNIINKADLKALNYSAYAADTEDTIYIDLSGATGLIGSGKDLSKKGKRIIVRLTFKDLPTRYRKWTESYEYVTKDGDTAATIAAGIAKMINGATKRARVEAKVGSINTTSASGTDIDGTNYWHVDSNWGTSTATTGQVVQLVAMKYDDDDATDTLNWANKVRFNANVYYTDPDAEGWASLNKNFITGSKIIKVPGKTSPASAKLVRDREAQAMGYEGILNRGMGTWPIIKPAMNVDLNTNYGVLTLEFENMYRAADDIFRKTKQTVEVYGGYGDVSSTSTPSMKYSFDALKTFLETFAAAVKNY